MGPASDTFYPMSYLVLARKWRPQTFDEVVGQGTVTRTLQNALGSGRIGHAFLLSGARGVGKTTTARILAKALNCSKAEAPTAEPCGECSSCVEIAAGTSLDVQEIDGATNNGVEQVRELRESARYNPARDRFKVWIIDEVHMLSTGAFNALLKTLEEPPPRVKFIFATTEYHKLPDTILSRCQQYDFRMIPAREIQAHLREVADGEEIKVSDEALARIARAAEGSVRDALSLFDQVLSFSGSEVRDEDLSALLGLIDRELLLRGVARGGRGRQPGAAGAGRAALRLRRRLSQLRPRAAAALPRDPAAEAGARRAARCWRQIVPEERERLRPLAAAFSEEDLLRVFDVLIKVEHGPALGAGPARHAGAGAAEARADAAAAAVRASWSTRVERLAGGAPRRRGAHGSAPAGAAPPATPAPRCRHERRAPVPSPAPARPPAPRPRRPASREPAAPAASGGLLAAHAGAGRRRARRWPSRCAARAAPRRATRSSWRSPPDFLPLARMHADEYRELARKAAGRPLKIADRAPRRRRGGGPPQPRRARDEAGACTKQAAREPAVQEVLDLFGGAHRRRARGQGGAPVNPFGNPQKLMKQIQQMQEKMQQEIAALEVEAHRPAAAWSR